MNKRIEMAVNSFFLSAAALCAVGCSHKIPIKELSSKVPSKSTVDIEMISIPAGDFLMGNSGYGDDKDYSDTSEFPQHSVSLSAYSIGKFEVTRGQYREFIKAGGYSKKAFWSRDGWKWKLKKNRTVPAFWAAEQNWSGNRAFTQTDNHPVIGVSYYEAEAFCKWAGGHLPTAAQWERAARWNPQTKQANIYPWGDVWDAEKCNNYKDHNSAGGGFESAQTAPVGSYPSGASCYGCQDMAGNAWEWCRDWCGEKYSKRPTRDPQGPATGYKGRRELRGGSWDGDYGVSYAYRCGGRGGNKPTDCFSCFGFRLVR